MPTLKQLIEEIEEMNIDPKKVRLHAQQYDELIDQAESQADDDEEE
jgi:hypothetical protein